MLERRYAAIVLFLAVFGDSTAEAQTEHAADDRPTIALVLSGGGAKGFAHIGAIQVFEEAGLPFDIIAGTSAGALMGSLYAVGYSGKQIEEIVLQPGLDLNDLFFDRVDGDVLRIEETRIPDETLVRFPLVGFKPKLPEGVVAGQRVVQFVSKYTWGFHHVTDFTQLPRPYTCNAVDLITGQDIMLTTGFLPEAARTCVSLPGFFKPFERDSLVLVDGGPSHMMPVPEARMLGGEILVGVDVSGDIGPNGEVQLDPGGNEGNLFFVFAKNIGIKRRSLVLDHRSQLALVVDPDVRGVNSGDYSNAPIFIERGRAAARKMLPQIRAFGDSLGNPQPRTVVTAPSLAPVEIGQLDIRGVDGSAEALVHALLAFDLPDLLGPDDVDEAISRLYGTQLFETVVYKLLPGTDGAPATLRVDVKPLEDANRIGIGFRYDDFYAASLLLTVELRNLLNYGSTTALVARLGRQTRLGAEYFTRLGPSVPITVGAGVNFTSGPLRFASILSGRFPDDDDDRPLLRQDLLSLRLSLGVPLTNKSLLGVRGQVSGYSEEVDRYPVTNEELIFDGERFQAPDFEGARLVGRYASGAVFLNAESFDRKAFPMNGYRAHLSAEFGAAARDDDELIERIEEITGPLMRAPGNDTFQPFRHYVADVEGVIGIAPTVALLGRASYSRGSGDGLPLNYLTSVGGIHTNTVFPGSFYPLYGLDSQARLGTDGWVALAGAQWEFAPKYFVQVFGNAGDAYFDLDLTDEQAADDPELAALDGFDFDRAALGVGATLGWGSPLGPARLHVGYAEGGPVRAGVSLGYDF